jgi:alpha-tubulin suppressor-like RCC1 family protein
MQISCGAFHTVVLLKNGLMYGFGSNLFGQLGQGGSSNSNRRMKRVKNFLEPSLIQSKVSKTYNQVACGAHHTLALTKSNRLVTWGYGMDGQLGLEKMSGDDDNGPSFANWEQKALDSGNNHHVIGTNIYRPKLVEALLDKQISGKNVIQIDSDSSTSMIDTGGSNDNNNNHSRHTDRIPGFTHLLKTSFCMVACGHLHSLALTVGGKIFAWGDNTYGQLGVRSIGKGTIDEIKEQASAAAKSSMNNYHSPTIVNASFGGNLCCLIACGAKHSMGISMNSGELFMWGDGSSGQLGDGIDSIAKSGGDCRKL